MSLWQQLTAWLLSRTGSEPGELPASDEPMKLVVGLGNHGREYVGTRHNVGYDVVDRLADKFGPVQFRRQFSGRLAAVSIGDQKTWLLKPETFMNRSGYSVQPALAFYGIELGDLLVICDDLNLPIGKLRIRPNGSDGGQKGLRSIAAQLGTTEYPRLRVGIGANRPGQDAADFVLERFRADERPLMEEAIARAVDAVVEWTKSGIDKCMSRFN